MPVFLTSALAMLAATFGRRLLTKGTAAAVAGGAGTALVLDDAGGLLPNVFGLFGDTGKPRRRRRRRALTSQDRDDIAFAAAFLSKSAMERFVVVMATRGG